MNHHTADVAARRERRLFAERGVLAPVAGTVVDQWACPCCERTIDVVVRPGRPRLYCSHACRQRAYRWRRARRAHTTSIPSWPAEAASAGVLARSHVLRTGADPLARRRDRHGREVTVCGVLAAPFLVSRRRGEVAPFLEGGARACRVCTALVRPRTRGLVRPGAMPAPWTWPPGTSDPTIEALRAIHPDYPLDPQRRALLNGVWAARSP